MDIWRHAGGPATAPNICLYVELKCVTTIYLLSLLFLCHCDLDFDVKEDEKSTLTPYCRWVDISTWTPAPQNWLYLRHSS